MAQISSILLSLHNFLCNDIIIWFLYYLLYLVILLSAISIKIYKKFNFNNYKLRFYFSIKKDWINDDGTYLRNVHITLLELSEFTSVVFYFVILY